MLLKNWVTDWDGVRFLHRNHPRFVMKCCVTGSQILDTGGHTVKYALNITERNFPPANLVSIQLGLARQCGSVVRSWTFKLYVNRLFNKEHWLAGSLDTCSGKSQGQINSIYCHFRPHNSMPRGIRVEAVSTEIVFSISATQYWQYSDQYQRSKDDIVKVKVIKRSLHTRELLGIKM